MNRKTDAIRMGMPRAQADAVMFGCTKTEVLEDDIDPAYNIAPGEYTDKGCTIVHYVFLGTFDCHLVFSSDGHVVGIIPDYE